MPSLPFLEKIQTFLANIETIARSISLLEEVRWEVRRLLDYREEQKVDKEPYQIEQEISVLKNHLASISFERLSHILRKNPPRDVSLLLSIRIIYTYSEDIPWMREWLMREFKDELIKSFSEIATHGTLVIRKLDIANINTSLRNDLDQFMLVSASGQYLVAHFTDTFSQDPAVQALLQTPEFQKLFSATFQFEEISGLDNHTIQFLLKEVSTEDLITALQRTSLILREKIYKNMSPASAQKLDADIESFGPVHFEQRRTAQEKILATLKRLAREEKITIPYRGDTLED